MLTKLITLLLKLALRRHECIKIKVVHPTKTRECTYKTSTSYYYIRKTDTVTVQRKEN